ncbi:protein translocase subunit SecF [Prauserella rugosa]|uniref:Protein-export membrane protein SecF n=1 Tax=Prauserella rugosa TaxID=43354 RepID=A0A660CE32_9PSEU|nr:protein translocase subunit SecF [Prauserella rugosa]KMS84046.1 preprotein translocase subunit SecF [Streptomyces regensis]TWH19749.1 preprotein translocase subunit SecF [Prauserella rugosa]
MPENNDNATGSPAEAAPTQSGGPKKTSVFQRLYTGTGAFDIVGHRKQWYIAFAVLVLVCIGGMGLKGFNLGIEFEGGTQIQLPARGAQGQIDEDEASNVISEVTGVAAAEAQVVGVGESATIQVRSSTLDANQVVEAKRALFDEFQPLASTGQPSQSVISDSAVSASWGGEISQQALIALAVFMVLVTIFLVIYFEKWMAVSALITLIHDIVVTAGVYAIVGFEVTPATVIGLLTILGYSLYDTVVVFDKVKENTRGLLNLTKRTYGEAANLALNQTLMRSINTSVIALLPVLGLMVVGYLLLGSGTLQDLALVQLTGMLVGVVSSVLLATPLLVTFKMRETAYREQAERVAERRAQSSRAAAREEAAGGSETDVDDDFDPGDDEQLETELRKERAYAAAASVPARTPKAKDRHRNQRPRRSGTPSGKRKRS